MKVARIIERAAMLRDVSREVVRGPKIKLRGDEIEKFAHTREETRQNELRADIAELFAEAQEQTPWQASYGELPFLLDRSYAPLIGICSRCPNEADVGPRGGIGLCRRCMKDSVRRSASFYAAHAEELRERSRAYYRENLERARECCRRSKRKRSAATRDHRLKAQRVRYALQRQRAKELGQCTKASCKRVAELGSKGRRKTLCKQHQVEQAKRAARYQKKLREARS